MRSADAPPLLRWEPRCRTVGLAALAAGITFVDSVPLLLPCAVAAGATALAARVPLNALLRRLRIPAALILVLSLILILTSGGRILFAAGPVQVSLDGLIGSLLIAGKLSCVVIIVASVMETVSMGETISALRGLGLPVRMADMLMVTGGFIHVTGRDFRRMSHAAALRGFSISGGLRRWMSVMPMLSGSLLVYGHERAVRVLEAMRVRGYGSPASSTVRRSPAPADLTVASVVVLFGATLAVASLLR